MKITLTVLFVLCAYFSSAQLDVYKQAIAVFKKDSVSFRMKTNIVGVYKWPGYESEKYAVIMFFPHSPYYKYSKYHTPNRIVNRDSTFLLIFDKTIKRDSLMIDNTLDSLGLLRDPKNLEPQDNVINDCELGYFIFINKNNPDRFKVFISSVILDIDEIQDFIDNENIRRKVYLPCEYIFEN